MNRDDFERAYFPVGMDGERTVNPLLAMPDVQGQVEAALRHGAIRWAAVQREALSLRIIECDVENPLEAMFCAWLHCALEADRGEIVKLTYYPQYPVEAAERSYRLDVAIGPSEDFVVVGEDFDLMRYPRIAVELDGHAFHEQTQEQVTARNQRDRDLRATGWKVFHFSRSEFLQDPWRCVSEVVSFADGAYTTFARTCAAALEQAGWKGWQTVVRRIVSKNHPEALPAVEQALREVHP